MKNTSQRYDINRPRPRARPKYTKQNVPQYIDDYMYQETPRQHLKLNS